MGAVLGKEEPDGRKLASNDELDPNNGLLFNEYYLPPEVVAHILGYLEPVLNGRRVCRAWREIIDTAIWREKVLREVPGATSEIFQHKELAWVDFYFLTAKKPHKKNLIKNGSAEERMEHWSVNVRTSFFGAQEGGNKWKIEKEPIGCDPFPDGAKRCFATSYDWCSAEQVINLQDFGLTRDFMKHVSPHIHIEEWYAGRFDCGFEYSLKVTLLTFSWDIVDSFVFETTGHSSAWTKVQHVFSNYNREVAFIVFQHKGKDTQFWAGHYGCKMTGAKVYVTLPGQEDQVKN